MATPIFNKNDINTLEEAKEYLNYYGGKLTDQEKEIFNSSLLTPNGTLDISLLQDTAELLNILKTSSEKVKTERMGLSKDGTDLLISLLKEQKGNSVPYQIINAFGSEKPVDKVISQFEDVLFSEFDAVSSQKIKKELRELQTLSKRIEELKKNIKNLEKKYNQEELDKQTNLENNIDDLVDNYLKNDLQTLGVGGRKFFDLIIKYNEIGSRERYTPTAPPSTYLEIPTYGSIIKTGYNGNNKPYAHPLYLRSDLQAQMWRIFKIIDKEKLFEYIDSSDCIWNASKKKEFKKAFSRIIKLNLKLYNIGERDVMLSSSRIYSKGERVSWCISDAFYVMHCLFPKDSNYSNSPFIQKDQKSCLQFNDTDKSIDTPYAIWWRGADASIFSKNYSDTSPSVLRAPFPGEEKHLTWANGQIPEFFWQVYNNDEVIDFSAYHEVLGPDANTMVKIREEPISVYEKKIRVAAIGLPVSVRNFSSNYAKYVENLIKNSGVISSNEADKLRGEWETIAEEMIKDFSGEVASTFASKNKNISFSEIKNKISIFNENTAKWIETYKGGVDSVTENSVINKWDKWKTITRTKRKTLDNIGAELGEKYSELNEAVAKELVSKQKIDAEEDAIEKAKEGRLEGLRKTFKEISVKTSKTYQEVLFLRSILGLVERYERIYPVDPTFDVVALRQELDDEQKAIDGILTDFNKWMKVEENLSFRGRLEKWKKSDGLYHNQEARIAYFRELVAALNSVGRDRLDVVQQTELEAIEEYLDHPDEFPEIRLTPMSLRFLLGITTNTFRDLVQKWINFSRNLTNTNIQEITDKVNFGNRIKKVDFVKYLKETLAKKPGLPKFPDSKASDQDILNWFFTLDPQIVISTIASQELAADSSLKTEIAQEMKKEVNDQKLFLDLTKYGDGTNFTETGIALYYYEKLGGLNHSYSKNEPKKLDPTSKEGFWRTNNPAAWLSLLSLLLLLAGIIWAIRKRKTLLQWWNAPSELEEELDEDEEED